MTKTVCFLAGLTLASLAPSIAGTFGRQPLPTAPETRIDDKEDAVARKRKKVEELFVAMNQKEVTVRTMDASMETFTEMGLPESFQSCFKEHFDIDHVLSLTVDIYAEQLEESTVDALVAFYKSDEGKSFIKALPDITVDSLKKSSAYGKQVGIDCAKEH